MARIEKGILGKVKGGIADITGYEKNGKNVIQSRNIKGNRSNTKNTTQVKGQLQSYIKGLFNQLDIMKQYVGYTQNQWILNSHEIFTEVISKYKAFKLDSVGAKAPLLVKPNLRAYLSMNVDLALNEASFRYNFSDSDDIDFSDCVLFVYVFNLDTQNSGSFYFQDLKKFGVFNQSLSGSITSGRFLISCFIYEKNGFGFSKSIQMRVNN